MHFQAFLFDGICRWNAARSSAAITNPSPKIRSFDVMLQDRLNSLSSAILGQPIDPNYRPPAVYTGELFGVEYLYNEMGAKIEITDVDKEIEEGMDGEDNADTDNTACSEEDYNSEVQLVCSEMQETGESTADFEQKSDATEIEKQSVDARYIEGWEKVDRLAAYLIDLEGLSMTNAEVEETIRLYEQLSRYDKEPLIYSRNIKPTRGRFGRSKNTSGHIGQEAMKRCFVSGGAPSLPPSKSRVVEAICIRLFNNISSPKNNPYVSRYALIIQKYNEIRNRIMQNPAILEKTGIALFPINETTVSLWYVNDSLLQI